MLTIFCVLRASAFFLFLFFAKSTSRTLAYFRLVSRTRMSCNSWRFSELWNTGKENHCYSVVHWSSRLFFFTFERNIYIFAFSVQTTCIGFAILVQLITRTLGPDFNVGIAVWTTNLKTRSKHPADDPFSTCGDIWQRFSACITAGARGRIWANFLRPSIRWRRLMRIYDHLRYSLTQIQQLLRYSYCLWVTWWALKLKRNDI